MTEPTYVYFSGYNILEEKHIFLEERYEDESMCLMIPINKAEEIAKFILAEVEKSND